MPADLVLTHAYDDPYNPDHPAANQISLQARVYAQAEGYPLPGPALGGAARLHVRTASAGTVQLQARRAARRDAVWEQKRQAMESMEAQRHLSSTTRT